MGLEVDTLGLEDDTFELGVDTLGLEDDTLGHLSLSQITNDINLDTSRQEFCHCNAAQAPSLVVTVQEGFPLAVGFKSPRRPLPGFDNRNFLVCSMWLRHWKKHQHQCFG